jgi:streptogramin lyase
MKTIKKIFAILFIIIISSCSKDDNQQSTPTSSISISSILPSNGAKGTAVLLTGIGFSPNASSNTVTINGKTCAVNSATTTTLNITIPPAAGTGKIKVTVGNDNAESTVFDFVVTTTVTTIAGSTQGDSNNGLGMFNQPRDLVLDNAGNIYLTDSGNNKIKKISSNGVITTFAGGTTGEGIFSTPFGITIDLAGNIYVADTFNQKIKKITPSGTITSIISGNDTSGNLIAARPTDLIVDATGNIYFNSSNQAKVKKVSSTGLVTTIVDNTSNNFGDLNGIVLDNLGNLFITDSNITVPNIRKITPAGVVTTFSNGGGSFSDIIAVCIDADNNLYVADSASHKIKKITPTGIVTIVAGANSGDGVLFNNPKGVAIDSSGNLYVADTSNHKIKKITFD